MPSRIRRALTCFTAALTVALALSVGSASPAAAFGGETFGCRVAPGTDFTWREFCSNTKQATTYNVGFAVLNTSGTYTYSWTITGPYQYVITGCTSTSYDCAVAVTAGAGDKVIDGTVTYTQNGQSATQWAEATVMPYCWDGAWVPC
ncbi:MAG: hypothetical protein ACJ73E_17580 [Mycobacteriales bacterium]